MEITVSSYNKMRRVGDVLEIRSHVKNYNIVAVGEVIRVNNSIQDPLAQTLTVKVLAGDIDNRRPIYA